jgi:hypothetical protein
MPDDRQANLQRLQKALVEFDGLFPDGRLDDANADAELKHWLDGNESPLPWSQANRVAADEWFFATTLYGRMTAEEQRSQIRMHFPTLFVKSANRDLRGFSRKLFENARLPQEWMAWRLCKMAGILHGRKQSMEEYTHSLRELESKTTLTNPTPALDAIIADLRPVTWKTLSVFVRDCVGGNCFPIDSRVEAELTRYQLPKDERQLVSLALELGRNPRRVARMFYQAREHR